MKNKMPLRKKIFYLIVSFFCACAFWYVGTGSSNDFVTRVFNNVPVNLINSNVLNEKGLTLVGDEDYFVNIQFRGTSKNLDNINAVSLKADADLSQINSAGLQNIDVTVSGFEQNVILEKILPSTIQLEVADYANSTLIPTIITEGVPGDNYAVVSASTTEEVTLDGPDAILKRVKNVSGVINVNGMTEDSSALVEIHAYDEAGNILDDITCSPGVVEANIVLGITKTVPIHPPHINGETDSQYSITNVKINPEKVTIAGKKEQIEKINEINTTSVNLPSSKRNSTFTTESELQFPAGIISVGDLTKVDVTVEIEPIIDRTYTISNLETSNLASNLDVKSIIPGSVTIQVEGTSTELEKIDGSKLTGVIDLKGLNVGEYNLPVNVTLDSGKIISMEPSEVSVELTQK